MRSRWAYLRLFLVLAVSSLATSACERAGREVPFAEDEGVPRVGSVAPDFTLHDLAGSPVTLSTLRGKVVLVNFWATWCVPCKREMPSMEILYQELKDRGLEILAVSSDPAGGLDETVRPFVEEYKLTFPILLDETFEVNIWFGVRGIPTSFLIDQEGRVARVIYGARDWATPEARTIVRQLLPG